ncbi:hypothetical protein KUCAC02_019236 [Chaenocephalus aceratus]|nr:hypothetical protein KUCAC02_019236 [Chaenocephalus aceratus]
MLSSRWRGTNIWSSARCVGPCGAPCACWWSCTTRARTRFVYTCNECKHHVETRFHCTVCEDYDLCITCYNTKGHVHKMEKLGLGLDDESSNSSAAATQSPGDLAAPQHPALHPVAGPRLPVPQRQLLAAVLPEDEARGAAHQGAARGKPTAAVPSASS